MSATEDPPERGLVAGAVLGILLAAAGIVGSGSHDGIPAGAVATVDGRPIAHAEYLRRLDALASDRRAPLGAEDRRRVLERMIGEELLLGRALALDLPRLDPRARKELVGAMIDAAVAEAASEEPAAGELERFFAEHGGYFAGGDRHRVAGLWFGDRPSGRAAMDRATEAVQALRGGEAVEAVRARLADAEPLPVPETALSPGELTGLFGPTAARTVRTLADGAVSDPLRVPGGVRVVVRLASEPAPPPGFDAVRGEVAREWRRRRGEASLERSLASLRKAARIRIEKDER